MRNTVRTFVAVEIPPETRQRAIDLINRLRITGANVRWVGAEQLHWTLKFLGEVELNDVPEICERVAEATANIEPFDVEAFGAGAFPNPHQPRTIWMGVRDGTDPMIALHGAVENQLAKLGFRKEQRRFRPHVTLGRVRHSDEGMQELANLIKENAEFDGGLSTVYEVTIFASQLGPKGPTYEPLGHADLADK